MKYPFHSGWIQILLLLAVTVPPLVAGLGASDCEFHMEVRTMATAQETWLRQQVDPQAWLIPTWNGAPRVNKPPLTVWLNMLVWTGLDPQTTGVDVLVYRARLVAAALAVLALLATWRMGAHLHSTRYGLLAAAITGTSLLFLRNARMASYDTYLLVFSTFAMASAVWAMQPRAAIHSRGPYCIGWALSGIAMAAAVLTKGPIALVMTALPLFLIALLERRRRLHLMGLGMALGITAAIAAPWYMYVLKAVPSADRIMGTEFKAMRPEFQPPWYYLGLIPLVAPWLLWLPAFWIAAARRHLDFSDPALRIPAVWFLAIFLVLSIPAAKQQRYILPILPAAGLLMAAAWQSLAARTALRWPVPLGRVHGGLLIVGALLMGAWGLGHPWLVASGALRQPEIARLPPWTFAAISLPLLLVARAAYRAARAHRLEAAAWLTAIWMAGASTPMFYDYSHTYHARFAQRPDVEAVKAIIGESLLLYVRAGDLPAHKQWPDPKMLLYSQRIIPEWKGGVLPPSSFLMAADHKPLDDRLRGAGWTPLRRFHDGNAPRTLYSAPP